MAARTCSSVALRWSSIIWRQCHLAERPPDRLLDRRRSGRLAVTRKARANRPVDIGEDGGCSVEIGGPRLSDAIDRQEPTLRDDDEDRVIGRRVAQLDERSRRPCRDPQVLVHRHI